MSTRCWTRRGFLASLLAVGSATVADAGGLLSWLRRRRSCYSPPRPPTPRPPTTPVRQDIRELTDQQLTSYINGVVAMKARPVSDPTSWAFQANMHGTFDAPPHPLWNQCQHGTNQFLTWHRGYIYYFERILRAASGDPTLCLPYWNWSEQLQLPDPFRDPGSPLFDSTRAINGGESLPPEITVDDLQAALGATDFWPWPGFSGRHEGSPHGQVHVQVSGNMSQFETAAQDPIFWLHHCNVDRVWDIWLNMNAGRENPHDTSFLDQQYSYFDETGTEQTVKVRDIVDSKTLGYRYDDVPNPPITVAKTRSQRNFALVQVAHQTSKGEGIVVAAPRRATDEKVPAATGDTRALGFKPERVELQTEADGMKTLRAAAAATPRPAGIVVEIQGIQLEQTPNFTFGVYLNLPEGVTDRKLARPYYIGSIDFFGKGAQAAKSHARRSSAAGHGEHDLNDFNQSFDASRVIAQLQREAKWRDDALSVTLLPLAPTAPRGDDEAIVARSKSSAVEAKISYRTIVLKVMP